MNIYNMIKEGISALKPKQEDIDELNELGTRLDPDVKKIIDGFTGTPQESRTAYLGNRRYYYSIFSKDPKDFCTRKVEEGLEENAIKSVKAIAGSTQPYTNASREVGFNIIYKDNIYEMCIYDRYAYIPGETNLVVCIRNEFTKEEITKELNKGKLTVAELDKLLVPLPVDELSKELNGGN